jgi:hypothetical protein
MLLGPWLWELGLLVGIGHEARRDTLPNIPKVNKRETTAAIATTAA